MKEMHGLSGTVYTQTTDVEGEVNGLFSLYMIEVR